MSILIIRLIIRKMIVSVNQYHHADRGNHLMKVRYQKFLDKFEMGQCHHSHFRIRSCSDHCSNKHSWRIRKLNMFETQGSYSTSSIVQMLSICALNLKVFKVLITSWKYYARNIYKTKNIYKDFQRLCYFLAIWDLLFFLSKVLYLPELVCLLQVDLPVFRHL